jgi:hypothetical protein
MQLPRSRQLQRVRVDTERLTECARICRSGPHRACMPDPGQMTSRQRKFPAGGEIAVYARSPIPLPVS